MFPAFLESIGTTELLVILVVALILFGPRRLPQLSRQLGKSLGEFKRASEEFKRTWEKEVELEKVEEEGRVARAMLPQERSILGDANERRRALDEEASATESSAPTETLASTVARSDSSEAYEQPAALTSESAGPETSTKRDWL